MKRATRNMFILFILFLQTLTADTVQQDQPGKKSPKLYIECGQLLHKPLKVYVTDKNFSEAEDPVLKLYQPGNGNKSLLDKNNRIDYFGNQSFSVKEKEQLISKTGTILLFNISDLDIEFYKSIKEYTPVLEWKTESSDSARTEVGHLALDKSFFVGHRVGAVFWTFSLIILLSLFFIFAARHIKYKLRDYITLGNREVSLSLLQCAAWTVVVGGCVLAFGLTQNHVPDIPETLIMLMGLSGITSLVGHYQSKQIKENVDVASESNNKPLQTSFYSMLYIKSSEGEFLSMAKAQLVFWTAISLVLFLSKSLLNGELWEVPEELVALMGISQATFIGRYQQAIIERKEKEQQAEDKRKNKDEAE